MIRTLLVRPGCSTERYCWGFKLLSTIMFARSRGSSTCCCRRVGCLDGEVQCYGEVKGALVGRVCRCVQAQEKALIGAVRLKRLVLWQVEADGEKLAKTCQSFPLIAVLRDATRRKNCLYRRTEYDECLLVLRPPSVLNLGTRDGASPAKVRLSLALVLEGAKSTPEIRCGQLMVRLRLT